MEERVAFVRLVIDHGCAVTVNGTTCIGFHPTKDLNFIRYAYPNNTWYGLGDPMLQRKLNNNNTVKHDNETDVKDMYTINIGNGTIVNLGIDRTVAGNEVNTTALAEGELPEGVEMYGAGWRSEYDVDDEEEGRRLRKREQLVSLRQGNVRRYAPMDLGKHRLSQDRVREIFTSRDREGHVFENPVVSSGGTIGGVGREVVMIKVVGSSIAIAIMVFLFAIWGLSLYKKRGNEHRGRGRIMLGDNNRHADFDGDAGEVDMITYVESGVHDEEEFAV